MAKRGGPPTIPDTELDVLKVLLDRGRGTVREILETLRAAGRPWTYATVATLLDRLEAKGMVTSDRSELAFVYRPAISAEDVLRTRVRSLVDKLYHGEPGLLVLHLLKSHPLDAAQAEEVRALLEEMTGQRPKTSGDPSSADD
jgi:BlaI family transcriptional regulator, penicillinase repressor